MVRKLLVEGPVERWDGTTEALLHFAARRDHLRAVVWPALEKGAWVVSDRFADLTLAYQGYGHGVDQSLIAQLYALSVGDFRPGLTLVLGLPVESASRGRLPGGSRPVTKACRSISIVASAPASWRSPLQ